MECLTDYQCILFLTEFGLNDIRRETFEAHFKSCTACSQKKEALQAQLQLADAGNRLYCIEIEENLVDYIVGDIDEKLGEKISSHLKKCFQCQYLYHKLIQSPLPDVKNNQDSSRLMKLPEKLHTFVEKLQRQLVTLANISIRPLNAVPAFLGSDESTGKKISHINGDIILNVGEKNKEVKLLSPKNVELDAQNSDENGVVVFKDFIGGEYRVQVEGFEVVDIKYKKHEQA
ncbi:hypothetical protein JXJ21_12260 [candidate division KSB1 bacterium]|nr:hypothetical protein [candidate division KSB1 bacterium]